MMRVSPSISVFSQFLPSASNDFDFWSVSTFTSFGYTTLYILLLCVCFAFFLPLSRVCLCVLVGLLRVYVLILSVVLSLRAVVGAL